MTSYLNKRILITGGAGFIGSHIAEQLILEGAHIVILDNLSTGSLENIKNIAPFIELIKGDIKNNQDCLRATKNIDVIFHLAAFISVPESIKDPNTCYETNIKGTESILDAASKNKVKNFVFSSSAAVYGDRNDTCHETDPLNPLSPYAKSKVEGEELCKEYASIYGINAVILRYFNVYGERQNPNSEYAAVVAKFTDMIKAKRPLTIYGSGKQTRDFIHVSEVVKANLIMGLQDIKGDIYNIATGSSIQIIDLIDKIKQQLKVQPVGINFVPARSGDILHSKADCGKYKDFSSKMSTLPLESNKRFLKELSD